MKSAAILAVLIVSSLAFGQKFEVTDLSTISSPVSFEGVAKASKTGTICTVTMRNSSTQSLLALEITGEVTSPWGWMQSTGLSCDGFFKESGFPQDEDFELAGPDLFDSMSRGRTYADGKLVKPQEPKKDLVCQAAFKVEFVQFADGSRLGEHQIEQHIAARRAQRMALLSHLVEAYDAGGEAAFTSAFASLSRAESAPVANQLKGEAEYRKLTLIDVVRKRLATAQKRQALGIF